MAGLQGYNISTQILTLYPDLLTFAVLLNPHTILQATSTGVRKSRNKANNARYAQCKMTGSARTLLLVVKSISIFNGDHLCYLVSIDSILVWLFIHAGTNLVSFPDPQNGLGTRLLLIQPHPRPASHTEARAQSRNEVRSKQKCLIASSYGVRIRKVRSVLLAPLGGVRAAAATTRAGATL